MARSWEIPGFDPDKPLPDCIRKILSVRFREMLASGKGASKGDPAAIHDMRVSCRRLLSVMKVFKKCFRGNGHERHLSRLKDIFRSLGRIREAQSSIRIIEVYSGSKACGAAKKLVSGLRMESTRELAALRGKITKLGSAGYRTGFYGMLKHALPGAS